MRLAVLGPVMLEGASGAVPVTPRKARELLTLLALEHPRPLSIDALAERMWNEPPPAAVKTIQGHLSRLRTALADAGCDGPGITGGPAGYRLEFDGELDVTEFNRCVSSGRQGLYGRTWAVALDSLSRARSLVRGTLELPATAAGDAQRTWFDELVAGVDEDRLEAAILADHLDRAIADLEVLTAAHPLRERLWELRMIALARAGRSAEALRTYVDARDVLADEVGIEPGEGLQRIEREILDGVTPAPSAPPVRASSPSSVVTSDAAVPRADIRYVEVDGIHVAYCTIGDGEFDIVHVLPGTIPIDAPLDEPRLAALLTRQTSYARVTWLNRRGIGLSERVSPDNLPTIDDWVRDIAAVLDDLRATSVVLGCSEDGNAPCLQLAQEQPDRVAGVVVTNLRPRFTRSDDYAPGFDPVIGEQGAAEVAAAVPREGAFDLLAMIAPSVMHDDAFRRWWDDAGRRGASPQIAYALRSRFQNSDLRPLLQASTGPILHLSNPNIPSYDPGHEQWLSANVANLESHHLAHPDELFWLDDTGEFEAHVERFVRRHARPRR